MNSILECSKRTVTKILLRMKIGCFNCSWNEAVCDLHHIVPQAKGGDDSHANLTYLCPNCHRLAHAKKILIFRTFEDVIGDKWKLFYNPTPNNLTPRNWTGKQIDTRCKVNLVKAREKRTLLASVNAEEKIKLLIAANIDMSIYGWKQRASKILDVSPQKVHWYISKYKPELLVNAISRKSKCKV